MKTTPRKNKGLKHVAMMLLVSICLMPTVAFAQGMVVPTIIRTTNNVAFDPAIPPFGAYYTYVAATTRYQISYVPQGVSDGFVSSNFFSQYISLDRTLQSNTGSSLDVTLTHDTSQYSAYYGPVRYTGIYRGWDNAAQQWISGITGREIPPNVLTSADAAITSENDEAALAELRSSLNLSMDSIPLDAFMGSYAGEYSSAIMYAMNMIESQGDMMPMMTMLVNGDIKVSVKKVNGSSVESTLSIVNGEVDVMNTIVADGTRLQVQDAFFDALRK